MVVKPENYIILSSAYQALPNYKLLDSIDALASEYDAKILNIPIKYRKQDEPILHPRIRDYGIVHNEVNLSKNVIVKNFRVRPQSIEPTTGLKRMAKANKTTIFGSPKQRWVSMANDKDLPKILCTTGFVTRPNYKDGYVISDKAMLDHKYGFMFCQLNGRSKFQLHPVQSLKNGKFAFNKKIYHGKTVSSEEQSEALVFGDTHAIVVDPKVHKTNQQMLRHYKPKKLFLNDLFDGYTVNHWNQGKQVDMWKDYVVSGLDLEKELKITYKVLLDYVKHMPKNGQVYVVKSNHDLRLDRWVNEARYIREPQNTVLGHKLFLAMTDGKDLLRTALEEVVGSIPDNVTFLSEDEFMRVRGYTIAHGHEKVSGGRSSQRTLEHIHGKSITAHTHTVQSLRDTHTIGTNTLLHQRYMHGYSGQMHCNGIITSIGTYQQMNIIDGKYLFQK